MNPERRLLRTLAVRSLLVMALVTLSACKGASSTQGSPGAAEVSPPVEEPTPEASDDDIKVEQTALLYLPDQRGGNFHDLAVLLRNESDQAAIDVSGQISILENGDLVQSITPISINILPSDYGLFQETVDLPKPVTDAEIEVHLSVERFQEWSGEAPVSFSHLGYRKGGVLACTTSGTVHNTFSEPKDDLQLRVAGFVNDAIVTSGFTYVDHVFPEVDATFEVDMFSPAECPPELDEIGVYPNLGEDKIFNP
jgi:hypothetical protein